MKRIFFFLALFVSYQSFGQEVIYHVFQRSFFDSNGDGHGDLKGMEKKLDYLQELGVTSILLTPLYQSDFYHNYFATDFEKIDPEYGTMDEYIKLVKAIHKRGMKIYQDVEMQYVTGDHPWYKASLGNPASPYSKYIYYLDSLNQKPFYFYNIQEFTTYNNLKQKIAVVNMNSPAVRKYTFDVLNFWVDPNKDGKFDDGVDGFRLDHMMDDLDNFKKVSNLFRDFWTPILKDLKKTNPSVVIIAEQANWFSLGLEYFRKAEVDRVFSFRLWWAIETFNKKNLTEAADSTLLHNPEGKQPIIFLENHDTRRFASAKEMNPGKEKAGAALSLLLGGVPLIYYGQELGMKGKQIKGTTDGNDIPIREAFEWYADNEGPGMALWYKNTGPWWDSTSVKRNDGISLEEERRDPGSLYNYYRKLISIRKSNPAIASGKYQLIQNDNEKIFSFMRYTDSQKVAVVVNLSGNPERTTIEPSGNFQAASSLLDKQELKFAGTGLPLAMSPYEVRIYALK